MSWTPREEYVSWRAGEVADQVLLECQVNGDLIVGFSSVKVMSDSSKNLFSGMVQAKT